MVSVIVHCQDDSRALRTTLSSLAVQVSPARELIVVETGRAVSTGDRLLRDYVNCDRTLHLHRPDLDRSGAFNLASRSFSSQWTVFLDAGDSLLPNSLDNFTSFFRRQPDCMVAFGRAVRKQIDGSLLPSREAAIPDGDVLERVLLGTLAVPVAALGCRREVFSDGIRFDAGFGGWEDLDFLLQLSSRYRFACVQEDVVITRPKGFVGRADERCLLLAHWGLKLANRLNPELLRKVRARFEHRAARDCSSTGRYAQALAHARRASELSPRTLRYWLSLTLLRSRRWLSVQRSSARRAA